MSPFELNKIAGAILFAALITISGWMVTSGIYHVDDSHGSVAYPLPGADEEEDAADEADGAYSEGEGEGAGASASAGDIMEAAAESVQAMASAAIEELLGGADLAKGKKLFKKCGACHTANEGGKNKVGPNLWNILGRDVAGVEGFNYSDALSAKGGVWDIATLNAFLTKPKEAVPGTKMSFSGIKKDGDRANLIAFLQGLAN
jgi:cytochrome c